MAERQRQPVPLILLFFLGLSRFINLGFEDLQAWDEALYAMRAIGIDRFGVWMDQTPVAVDGLYSSLHPPLYVWLTAIVLKILGTSEFSLRFISALAGAATLPVIYEIGKLLHDERTGLFASLLFGLNPFVSFFSRQGQFDSLMVFFLSASVLFLLRHHLQQRRFSLMLAGLSLAAALMTKAFVGLGILAAYAFWGFSQSKTDRLWRDLLKVAILASLSIPWFAYMTILHGNGDVLFVFRQSALLDRTLTGIEGNVKPTEILYFVNQLVVLFPLGVCFFIAGIFRTMKEGEQGWKLLALLFLVFFFTFSLIRTKLAVYLLPMLVPASLFAASELRALADNSRRSLIIFCGSAVALFWSASQEWRNSAKAVLGSITSAHIPEPEDVTNVMFFIFLSVATCTALFILSRKETWTRLLRIYPSFIFSAAFVWYGANIFYYDTVRYRDGAEGLRDFVSKSRHTSIVVAGFERNPQLTYYLDGADIGWKSDIHIRRIIPPADRNSLRSWLHDEVGAQGDRILLIVEKDKLIRYEIIDPTLIIPPGFERIFESRRYACFQREPEILLARHLAQPIKQPRQQFQIQKTPE